MNKSSNALHANIHLIVSKAHLKVSKGEKNRYLIAPEVLVLFDSGRVIELYKGNQGVRYHIDGERLCFEPIVGAPKWPDFSIVNLQDSFLNSLVSFHVIENADPLKVFLTVLSVMIKEVHEDGLRYYLSKR